MKYSTKFKISRNIQMALVYLLLAIFVFMPYTISMYFETDNIRYLFLLGFSIFAFFIFSESILVLCLVKEYFISKIDKERKI